MGSFDWRFSGPFLERYAQLERDDVDGVEIWSEIVRGIEVDERNPPPDAADRRIGRFDQLVEEFGRRPPRPLDKPRVFISHRQVDVGPAERIAWLASREAGMDYWLDVHDPALIKIGIAPRSPNYPLLVASTIEMALLNCTHVIAAHTPYSLLSKWIPYEFGRLKERKIKSKQAAGWFHTGIHPGGCGEFVLLADILDSDDSVRKWLTGHARPPIQKKPFRQPQAPPPLP